jgi:hypothetical protein
MDGLKAVPFKEFGFFRNLFSHATSCAKNDQSFKALG